MCPKRGTGASTPANTGAYTTQSSTTVMTGETTAYSGGKKFASHKCKNLNSVKDYHLRHRFLGGYLDYKRPNQLQCWRYTSH